MELSSGAYGSVRTDEPNAASASGPKRRVSVETFSSFSRKDAPVQHSLAKTVKTVIEVDHRGEHDVEGGGESGGGEEDGGAWKARLFALAAPAVTAAPDDAEVLKAHVGRCTRLSLWINIALTIIKLYNVLTSGSLAVLASLVDSCLDLAQTVVLYVVERKAHLAADEEYPAGRSRLEPVGVIVCAMLMAVGSLGVIYDACGSIVEGVTGAPPPLDVSFDTIASLVATILSKFWLWAYCAAVADRSSTALALGEDHANDVMSNSVAVFACAAASLAPALWWADPGGAVAISVYIILAWWDIAKDHIEQIVGKGAEPEQILALSKIASSFKDGFDLGSIRAYHFGPNFIVELGMVVSNETTVSETHDWRVGLAAAVEELPWVERCFVTIDDRMHADLDQAKCATDPNCTNIV